MKTLLIILISIVLSGCGVELLTTTAIQGELQGQQMNAMKRQISNAGDMSSRTRIQKAIDTYNAEKGYFPTRLAELVPNHIASIPKKSDGTEYGYNPSTGRLLDSPMPTSGLSQSDNQKMDTLELAIYNFGSATGFYPGSLDDLVPNYLSSVPKTDSGVNFLYYPRNGALYHPDEQNQLQQPVASQQQFRQTGNMGYGAGPLGETMTGIGIQNQLNSNSNAGVTGAGSYMRRNTRGMSGQYGDEQMETMDELGL